MATDSITNTSRYLDAQRAIVGHLLFDGKEDKYDTIRLLTDEVGLNGKAFDNEHYRYVYEAAQELYADRARNDVVSIPLGDIFIRLEEKYRTNGHANTATSLMTQWRNKIQGTNRPPDNVRSAAETLKNQHLRDWAKEEAADWIERVRKSPDPIQEIASFGYYCLGLAESQGDNIVTTASHILAQAGGIVTFSTGYPWIDKHVLWNNFTGAGGWALKTLTMWVAPSEHGKTSAATSFAVKQALSNHPVVWITAEDSPAIVAARVVRALSGLPGHVAMNPVEPQEVQAVEAAKAIADRWIYIYNVDSGNTTEIETRVRRHRMQHGYDAPMLVIVDHINAFDTGSGNWSRDLERVAKGLNDIAQRQNVALLVFSQAPEQVETEFKKKNYTTIFEARGSRGVRQWSHFMIFGARHNSQNGVTIVQRGKNRYDEARIAWGLYRFDTTLGIISDELITDDFQAQCKSAAPAKPKYEPPEDDTVVVPDRDTLFSDF